MYALSEEGRRRFEEFPDVIADDGYVRMLFGTGERVRVDDAPVRVYAPQGLSDLVRIKTRSRLGRYELRQRFPDLVETERTTKSYRNAAWTIVVDRGCGLPRWSMRPSSRDSSSRPQAARIHRDYVWERDQSSRRPERR